MNKKISKTLLVLLIAYTIAFYILKYAFPELLLEMLVSPNVMKLGNFIDSWIGYQQITKFITTFITLYLFTSASCGKFKFKWYEFLYIIFGCVICRCCSEFFSEFYTHTSISVMLLLSLLCNGDFKQTVVSFIIYGYISQFSFKIKGFETIITQYNMANALMLGIEVYAVLMILTLFFKLKEK